MASYLFESFLEREDVYLACKRYWRDLARGVEADLNQVGEWPEWRPTTWEFGTPMLEIHRIHHGYSRRLGRAYEILQDPPEERSGIVGWLKNYDDDPTFDDRVELHGDDWPPVELTIALCLSEETSDLARALLTRWMTPETTLDDIQRTIATLPEEGS